jgi:hypothetical protein
LAKVAFVLDVGFAAVVDERWLDDVAYLFFGCRPIERRLLGRRGGQRGAASLQQRQRRSIRGILRECRAAMRERLRLAVGGQQQLSEMQAQFQRVWIAFDRSRQLTNQSVLCHLFPPVAPGSDGADRDR